MQPFIPPSFADTAEPPRDAEARFAASFEQAAVGMAHVGLGGALLLVNRRLCELAGRAHAVLLGLGFRDIVHSEDRGAVVGLIDSLASGAIGSCRIEARLLRGDGAAAWIGLSANLVRGPRGEPDFIAAVVDDIDARKRAELGGRHDPLTGLLNRRGLKDRLARELDRSANDGSALTLAVIEVAGIEAVNETASRAEGDRCLRAVGDALARLCRPADGVARVGGNSFILFLPGLDRDAASAVLLRVEAALAALAKAERWPIAFPLGTACRPGDGATATSLVARAAARMNAAKAEAEKG